MASTHCANEDTNAANCGCSYMACDKRGVCCDCIRNHLPNRQLPGCFFPPDVEKTYDRSFKRFVETHKHLLD